MEYFFSNAGRILRSNGFTDTVFADDLTGMKVYPSYTSNDFILADMRYVQSKLHAWGENNCVSFDASKESDHILSSSRPHGDKFKLLGITFDLKNPMYFGVLSVIFRVRFR